MRRIAIFGASGLLGSSLVPVLRSSGNVVFTQARQGCADWVIDPNDVIGIARHLKHNKIDIVVNLAALTNVDYCEEHPYEAYMANVKIVESLCIAIESIPPPVPRLVLVSTDQVYDGDRQSTENDVRPINIYGWSKYAGELVARQVGATALRTNFVGRSLSNGRPSFSDWVVQSLRLNRPIVLFDDVFFSPLHLETLCKAVSRVIERPVPGVYNVGSTDGDSKAAFALQLAKRLCIEPKSVVLGKLSDANLSARRPHDMRMDVSLFMQTFQLTLPDLTVTVDAVARDYQE